jgi:peptidoglycan-N-acetylglucosamine deacetylase
MSLLAAGCAQPAARAAEPVPDKLVVVTFDDAVESHNSVVRPLPKGYVFSATFFITEGFTFLNNKKDYLTWEQIAELHRDGFEISRSETTYAGLQEVSPPALRVPGEPQISNRFNF